MHRKSYSLEFRRQLLDSLKENDENVSKTAKQYGIQRKIVQRWRQQKRRLDKASERRDVSTRKGRRLFRTGHLHGRHPELEKLLVEWIKARREEQITVNGPDVQ